MKTLDLTKISKVGELYTPIMEEILDRNGKPKEFSWVNLPEIDNRIWGFKRKKFVTIAARPSQGKSAIMLDQAITFAMQGRTILFFTFEMTKEECVERLISRCCSIDNFELMTGRVANDWDTHKDKLNEFYEKLNSLKLIFIESIGKTFDELFCIIETLNTPIDAIFIDYIQLVKSQNTSKNEKQVIDDYINKLYAYTKTKNFLTIVGSQINRSTHNGKQVLPPEIWEIKGSGAVEEISDLIILLHWQWFYTREEEKKYDYWIRVAKNRGGRTGVFNCQYFPHYYQFKEYQQVDKNFLSKPVKKETNDYTNRD